MRARIMLLFAALPRRFVVVAIIDEHIHINIVDHRIVEDDEMLQCARCCYARAPRARLFTRCYAHMIEAQRSDMRQDVPGAHSARERSPAQRRVRSGARSAQYLSAHMRYASTLLPLY